MKRLILLWFTLLRLKLNCVKKKPKLSNKILIINIIRNKND